MTKLQFLLISAIVSSAIFVVLGSREDHSSSFWLPIAIISALTFTANRLLTRDRWERVAVWVNQATGKRVFKTRNRSRYQRPEPKLLPPSRARRLD